MTKEYPLTHQQGSISLDNMHLLGITHIPQRESHMIEGDLGIQIAEDGRVWMCINGIAFARFKPIPKETSKLGGRAHVNKSLRVTTK